MGIYGTGQLLSEEMLHQTDEVFSLLVEQTITLLKLSEEYLSSSLSDEGDPIDNDDDLALLDFDPPS